MKEVIPCTLVVALGLYVYFNLIFNQQINIVNQQIYGINQQITIITELFNKTLNDNIPHLNKTINNMTINQNKTIILLNSISNNLISISKISRLNEIGDRLSSIDYNLNNLLISINN